MNTIVEKKLTLDFVGSLSMLLAMSQPAKIPPLIFYSLYSSISYYFIHFGANIIHIQRKQA